MPPSAIFRILNSNLKICEKELTKVVYQGVWWVQPFDCYALKCVFTTTYPSLYVLR